VRANARVLYALVESMRGSNVWTQSTAYTIDGRVKISTALDLRNTPLDSARGSTSDSDYVGLFSPKYPSLIVVT